MLEVYDPSLNDYNSSPQNFQEYLNVDSIEQILHFSPEVPVAQVMVPQLFSSKFFSIPKFLCGSIVVLRNVQPWVTRGRYCFPLVTVTDSFALSGLQGANQARVKNTLNLYSFVQSTLSSRTSV